VIRAAGLNFKGRRAPPPRKEYHRFARDFHPAAGS